MLQWIGKISLLISVFQRHHTQHNDTQRNDIQHTDIHNTDTQHNDTIKDFFALFGINNYRINNTQHYNTVPLC